MNNLNGETNLNLIKNTQSSQSMQAEQSMQDPIKSQSSSVESANQRAQARKERHQRDARLNAKLKRPEADVNPFDSSNEIPMVKKHINKGDNTAKKKSAMKKNSSDVIQFI